MQSCEQEIVRIGGARESPAELWSNLVVTHEAYAMTEWREMHDLDLAG